ncbi:hypothetical protein HAX54_049151, partial [Datura stramonium]|nr:hypothetical protein [Datura stramonium]
ELENQIPSNTEVELEVCRMKEQDSEKKVEEVKQSERMLDGHEVIDRMSDKVQRKENNSMETNEHQQDKVQCTRQQQELTKQALTTDVDIDSTSNMSEDDTTQAIERDRQLRSVSKNLEI